MKAMRYLGWGWLGVGLLGLGGVCAGADGFAYGEGERPILVETFDAAERWQLDTMHVAEGELRPDDGAEWSKGTVRFETPIDLREQALTVYWRYRRVDVKAGPENTKLYLFCLLTDDPALREQSSIAVNIRPGNVHFLYADPGWERDHVKEVGLKSPSRTFDRPTQHEAFRLQLVPDGTGAVEADLAWWDGRRWVDYDRIAWENDRLLPVRLVPAEDLDGRSAVRGIMLQTRTDKVRIDAVAATLAEPVPTE